MPYFLQKFNYLEDRMGFKKMDNSLGFADLALASSLEHNRSVKLMEKLDNAIDWTRVETILLSHYTVGPAVRALMLIHRCCCSNACCCKNGFASIPIRNLKIKSTIGSPLKNSSSFLLASPLRITLHSLAFGPDYPKMPWMKSILRSYDNSKQRG